MNKVLSTMLAVMVACLLFLGWHTDQQGRQIGALTAQNQTLTEAAERAVARQKLDRQVLVARQAQIASQARKLKDVQNRLSAALERNKAWSDADVPPDIIGGLAGPSGALPDGLPVGTEGQDCEGTPSSCPVTGVPSTVP